MKGELLREVAKLYVRQQRQIVDCCEGTSLTTCWIITELGRAGDSTLTALATAIGLDKSWTSRAVDALVRDGLVKRDDDATDARKVRLSLTPRGRRRFEAVNGTLDEHARRVMRHIPPQERSAVTRALELVYQALMAETAAEVLQCS
jgi:DNA-binding MarR family transcriptional regulator